MYVLKHLCFRSLGACHYAAKLKLRTKLSEYPHAMSASLCSAGEEKGRQMRLAVCRSKQQNNQALSAVTIELSAQLFRKEMSENVLSSGSSKATKGAPSKR